MAALYWSVGSFYTYLDLCYPKWAQKYKLQPGKNEPVDTEALWKVTDLTKKKKKNTDESLKKLFPPSGHQASFVQSGHLESHLHITHVPLHNDDQHGF